MTEGHFYQDSCLRGKGHSKYCDLGLSSMETAEAHRYVQVESIQHNQVECLEQTDLILYYLVSPGDIWKVCFFTGTQLYPLRPKAKSLLVHPSFAGRHLPMKCFADAQTYYSFPLEFLISTLFSFDLSRVLPKLCKILLCLFLFIACIRILMVTSRDTAHPTAVGCLVQ